MKNVTLYPLLLFFLFIACQPKEHEYPDTIAKQEKTNTKFRLYTSNGDNSETINYLSAYLFENELFIEEFTNLIPDSNNEISLEFNKKTGQHLYFVANAAIIKDRISIGITTEKRFNDLTSFDLSADIWTNPLYFFSTRYDISSETHVNIELLRSVAQINIDATSVPEILINKFYIYNGDTKSTQVFYQIGRSPIRPGSLTKTYTPAVSGLKDTIRIYENEASLQPTIYFTYNGVNGRCSIQFPHRITRNELYYIRLRKDDTDTTIHGDLSILPWTSGDDINAFPD